MVIGPSGNFPVLPAPRESLSPREEQTRQEQRLQGNTQQQESPEAINREAIQRRVEALEANEEGRFSRQKAQSELPLSNQKALEAYSNNQSVSELDGIELVGIDIFV